MDPSIKYRLTGVGVLLVCILLVITGPSFSDTLQKLYSFVIGIGFAIGAIMLLTGKGPFQGPE